MAEKRVQWLKNMIPLPQCTLAPAMHACHRPRRTRPEDFR